MAEPSEIELKLALVKGSLAHATRLIGKVDFVKTSIEDVYFDTPEALLRHRGLVLRIRRDGDRWLQTLKAAGTGFNVLPVRGEWEVALPSGKTVPALDLERFEITPLRVLLRAGFKADKLVPVFRTRIARRRGMLVRGESHIEVALDRGELRARVDGHRRRQAVAEVELELKSGLPQDLLALGAALVGQRHGPTLVPALRSKSERGYALATGDAHGAARASARGFAEAVEGGMSTSSALRALVRHGLAIVVTNADALRERPGNEHVHQARVALRRMRSAVRLFDANGEDFPARALEGLRWLARMLGEARDWDVIVDETLPSALSALGTDSDGQRRLQRVAKRARKRALERAVDAVSSRRYAHLVLRMARWSMKDAESGSESGTLGKAAAGLLEEAADRLFKDVHAFARLSQHKRHRVRIHAKRLRYALDLLGPTLGERTAADYTEALAALQDLLGELNDASVAVDRLARLVGADGSRKLIIDWFGAVEPDLVIRAARQLDSLARRPRPWALR